MERQQILAKLATLEQEKGVVTAPPKRAVIGSRQHKDSQAERKKFREEVLKWLSSFECRPGDALDTDARVSAASATEDKDETATEVVKAEQLGPSGEIQHGNEKREKKVVSTNSRVPSGKNNSEENESQHLRDMSRMSTVS
ncbi:UNVERIFIED_CONTAM: hypothetical protein K2H54_012689 [Gekko kuhli]